MKNEGLSVSKCRLDHDLPFVNVSSSHCLRLQILSEGGCGIYWHTCFSHKILVHNATFGAQVGTRCRSGVSTGVGSTRAGVKSFTVMTRARRQVLAREPAWSGLSAVLALVLCTLPSVVPC